MKPTAEELYKALDALHIACECATEPEVEEWYRCDPLAAEARQNAIEVLLMYNAAESEPPAEPVKGSLTSQPCSYYAIRVMAEGGGRVDMEFELQSSSDNLPEAVALVVGHAHSMLPKATEYRIYVNDICETFEVEDKDLIMLPTLADLRGQLSQNNKSTNAEGNGE